MGEELINVKCERVRSSPSGVHPLSPGRAFVPIYIPKDFIFSETHFRMQQPDARRIVPVGSSVCGRPCDANGPDLLPAFARAHSSRRVQMWYFDFSWIPDSDPESHQRFILHSEDSSLSLTWHGWYKQFALLRKTQGYLYILAFHGGGVAEPPPPWSRRPRCISIA